jgi:hypothetical protein
MSRIDSWYRKISTGRHFQNGCHNTAQIQHCSISTSWIDSQHRKTFWTRITRYDYNLTIMKSPKPATDNRFKKLIKSYLWNRTMLNFCSIVVAILKMETGRNFSMLGINSGRWNRTMLNLCSIVAAILKMATGRNCLISGTTGQNFMKLCGVIDICF